VANWTPGDKEGFGTATDPASKVWFTLADGELTEAYAPDLGTPSLRNLQFVVSDGATFTEDERDDAVHQTQLADPRSLTYQQVNTARSGRWRITKTYVTDPASSAVLVDVTFESLTNQPYQLYVLCGPALSNTGDDDRGERHGDALVAFDAANASALMSAPALGRASTGYQGISDGWTDLRADHQLDWTYDSAAQPGNVVQIASIPLTGLGVSRHLTLALAFAPTPDAAADTAASAIRGGFETSAQRYAAGWHDYLSTLQRPPSAAGLEHEYDVSLMVLAATEDKTFRGGMIAAPSMPWIWATSPATPARTTSCGRATSTRLPRRCWPPGTEAPQNAPWTTSGSASRGQTDASRRTPTWTARPTGPTCSSTRWPTRFCCPGSSAASTP
jgi:glucoamylase